MREKIVILIEKNGIKIYGNKQAFKIITERMRKISESPMGEHYEFHLCMGMLSDECMFNSGEFSSSDSNITVLKARDFQGNFTGLNSFTDFDITFMGVEDSDIDSFKKNQKDGYFTGSVKNNKEGKLDKQ